MKESSKKLNKEIGEYGTSKDKESLSHICGSKHKKGY